MTDSFHTLVKLGQATLGTTVASLLSVVIVFTIAVLWTLWHDSSVGKCIYRYRWLVGVLLVLAILGPLAFWLFKSTPSSWSNLMPYARELLASVIFVASASITLKALARRDYDKASELEQQLAPWEKWSQGDDTGWHELWEELYYGGELRPVVRSAVEQELRRVQQARPEIKSSGYKAQLQLLLLSPSEVSKLRSSETVLREEEKSFWFIHSDTFVRHIAADLQAHPGAI